MCNIPIRFHAVFQVHVYHFLLVFIGASTWHISLSLYYFACLCLGVSCTVCVRRGGCACLVLPHGSHTGTLGLPDGFWLSERFGFPSAYSSPIHVVFLDRVFHSARVGITWHSRAAGFAPPNLGNSYVILSCSIYHTHHDLHTNFHCIPFLSLASRDYTKPTSHFR